MLVRAWECREGASSGPCEHFKAGVGIELRYADDAEFLLVNEESQE